MAFLSVVPMPSDSECSPTLFRYITLPASSLTAALLCLGKRCQSGYQACGWLSPILQQALERCSVLLFLPYLSPIPLTLAADRFAVTYLTDFVPWPTMREEIVSNPHVSPRDRYILSKLNTLTADCNRFMENYSFGALANALHSFFIYEVTSSSSPSLTFSVSAL
jgi:hypothetical protein